MSDVVVIKRCSKCGAVIKKGRCPTCAKASYKKWYESHKLEKVTKGKRYRWALRVGAIEAYGGKCECCGEAHPEFLLITDNVLRKGASTNFYVWLKKNNYPAGYKVYCYNCKIAHELYGYCPHKEKLAPQQKERQLEAVVKERHLPASEGLFKNLLTLDFVKQIIRKNKPRLPTIKSRAWLVYSDEELFAVSVYRCLHGLGIRTALEETGTGIYYYAFYRREKLWLAYAKQYADQILKTTRFKSWDALVEKMFKRA
jgi:hypothetical protein